jgi:GNAT superfamily N-acetyltransferase
VPADLRRLRRVCTRDAAELLRELRNEVRDGLHDSREISETEQRLWFAAGIQRFAYLLYDDDTAVGWANLVERGGRTWITLGVRPAYQGRGYGTAIYGEFTDVWALISESNAASLAAASAAGYTEHTNFQIPGWVILYRD